MSLLHRIGSGLRALGLLVVSCAGCNEVKQEDLVTKSAQIYEAGNKAQKAGNYPEAIATFSQLIKTDPEEKVLVDNNKEDYFYYTWALYARGIAKMESGATDDAIRDFTYLIHWQPSNVDALIQRGMAYRSKKLLDVALRDFSDAIRARPDDKLAYLQRAIVHFELNNYDNAISDGMQAIRLQPQNAE